jgi:hypothetical protein
MLFVVVVGFAPTLSLRPLFNVPEIPPYLYVHGIVLTAWFVLFFAQAALIGAGRAALHRQMGVVVVTIGVIVPAAGIMATLGGPSRIPDVDPAAIDVDLFAEVAGVTVANIAALMLFALALLGGVLSRRQAEAHKRFMIWASLFLLPPAFARVARWPVFPELDEGAFVGAGIVLAMVLFVAHDLWRRRRPHWATIVCMGSFLVVGLGLVPILLRAESIRAWVRSLF